MLTATNMFMQNPEEQAASSLTFSLIVWSQQILNPRLSRLTMTLVRSSKERMAATWIPQILSPRLSRWTTT